MNSCVNIGGNDKVHAAACIMGRESPNKQCYECANCKEPTTGWDGSKFRCAFLGKDFGTWHYDVPNECPCKGKGWKPKKKEGGNDAEQTNNKLREALVELTKAVQDWFKGGELLMPMSIALEQAKAALAATSSEVPSVPVVPSVPSNGSENETLAEIEEDLRSDKRRFSNSDATAIASRIQEARKRQEQTHQKELDALNEQIADLRRQRECATAEKSSVAGDVAKLREELFASRDFIDRVLMFLHGMETTFPGEDEIIDKIRSALGEAPKMATDPRSHIFKI